MKTGLGIILRALPMAAAVLALADPAPAQDYPTHDLKVVVGFAPGGATDLIARLVGQKLGERLGQTVVVENRGGASGAIASREVSEAAPDGYTLLAMTSSLAISETANPKKGFSVNDLRPIAIVAISPYAIAVHPSNPAQNLKEFVTNGQTKKFTYGSPGVGSGPHIGAEYFFKEVAKVQAVHVPFANSRAEVAAQGGHIDAVVISLPAITQAINENLLRGLAVASAERNNATPQVPTLAESGFPGINLGSWNGFFVPAKTPDALVEKLNGEINQIMQQADVQEKLKSLGFDVMIRPLPETNEYFKTEVANWSKMVTVVGFKSE
jgi:tripartite-type tricarboxylate transporter receptor subunit TctC